MQLKPLAKGRFHSLWQQEHDAIEQTMRDCITETKTVPAQYKLMQQGQQVNALILVNYGRISMGYTARNGRSFQLGTMTCDSQIFGEMEFFTDYLCQLDIIAEEALEISIINGEKLQQALVKTPQFALFFASAIAIDYQDTVDIFTRRMLYPIAYNIAYDLYHQYLNDLPVEGFTKCYLEAERFATTDRVYRRAVKKLEDLNLIKREREGLVICDLAGLKAFIE
ncbi:Crp/Fnr family transcriptional regulator [Shewanella schlegeliana]|uniref:Crp/Fnr family transcriptional regulator n=1 Tax=Shewanella schlegeliana TaxID=190308 RepID=A0ABS1SWW0_9GAMM|nr:Crp/Fnr family transcriptional regulator [Shewanella schlegeliana]MBL4913035.1 Crp/Fnr family transcriptional regulator [Shewanella schlegeliana]MCL1108869.1 Crp/Fnr family transcriptional regulator [Shewanella schlegeliana]GIU23921.1 cyclic nucleotide-binding protein [Shewanella schlegeliana]